jgi:hypothetical protein
MAFKKNKPKLHAIKTFNEAYSIVIEHTGEVNIQLSMKIAEAIIDKSAKTMAELIESEDNNQSQIELSADLYIFFREVKKHLLSLDFNDLGC